jgi:hypothetical protein
MASTLLPFDDELSGLDLAQWKNLGEEKPEDNFWLIRGIPGKYATSSTGDHTRAGYLTSPIHRYWIKRFPEIISKWNIDMYRIPDHILPTELERVVELCDSNPHVYGKFCQTTPGRVLIGHSSNRTCFLIALYHYVYLTP